jgi:Superfamily II DNA/RNA helicases, SNF2 family
MFEFKTKPYSHQKQIWLDSRDREYYGILAEMGTGKTKMTLDTAMWLYEQGEVNGVLVVAPNGVHRAWVEDEIPGHVHLDLASDSGTHFYEAKRANTQWHKAAVGRVIAHDGLAWLAMSYDAFITDKGKRTAWDFLRTRRVLYVLDESTYIKTPGTKRTKSIVASAKYAPYRRILTGTPVTQGPFDVYSQVEFLDHTFWKQHGLGNFFAFKNTFGVFKRLDVRVPNQFNKDGSPKVRAIQQVVDYKNVGVAT